LKNEKKKIELNEILESFVHIVPVDNIPERLYKLSPKVLVIKVIRVLPNI